MRELRKFQVVVVALLAITICACATTLGTKALTPKQQATVWISLYNSTYDDTMAVATNPLSTPDQKEMVVKKKVILAQVWPLLRVYAAIIDAGGTPTADVEAEIITLINQLTALAISNQK